MMEKTMLAVSEKGGAMMRTYRLPALEMMLENGTYEQMPPFWAAIAEHLLLIGVVLLVVGGALLYAEKRRRPQKTRLDKAASVAGWALCLLAMMALVTWALAVFASMV